MKTRAILFVVTVSVAATDAAAATPRYRCFWIRSGETAAQIARRLTGDDLNRRASWFQIFDSRRHLVRKADYDMVHPGWRACLAEAQVEAAAAATPPSPEPPRALPEPRAPVHEEPPILAHPFVWGIALIAAAALSTAVFVAMSWETRRMRAREMQRFGNDFVREFARPWAQYRGAGPLPRTRLRISPSRARVDILVAPSPGRIYPNLSDHRINVAYDVARVTATLQRDSFTSGQPYAEGEWVVLPFHFRGRLHKEGVR